MCLSLTLVMESRLCLALALETGRAEDAVVDPSSVYFSGLAGASCFIKYWPGTCPDDYD